MAAIGPSWVMMKSVPAYAGASKGRPDTHGTSLSLMTVKAFTEHDLTGNLRPAGKLLAHQDDEKGFSLKKLRCRQYFGYKFGYRRQFALISVSYAKLQVGMGLAGSLDPLDYAYLS